MGEEQERLDYEITSGLARYLLGAVAGTLVFIIILFAGSVFESYQIELGIIDNLIRYITSLLASVAATLTIYKYAFGSESEDVQSGVEDISLQIKDCVSPPFDSTDDLSSKTQNCYDEINWADKTEEERAAHLIRSPYWHESEVDEYPEFLRRLLRSTLEKLGRKYLEFGSSLMTTIAVALIGFYFTATIGRGIAPSILVALTDSVSEDVSTSPILVIVSSLIIFVLSACINAFTQTKCPKCGDYFSLQNVGRFYRDEAVKEVVDKNGGDIYTYYEIHGKRVVYCPECNRVSTRDEPWTRESAPRP